MERQWRSRARLGARPATPCSRSLGVARSPPYRTSCPLAQAYKEGSPRSAPPRPPYSVPWAGGRGGALAYGHPRGDRPQPPPAPPWRSSSVIADVFLRVRYIGFGWPEGGGGPGRPRPGPVRRAKRLGVSACVTPGPCFMGPCENYARLRPQGAPSRSALGAAAASSSLWQRGQMADRPWIAPLSSAPGPPWPAPRAAV